MKELTEEEIKNIMFNEWFTVAEKYGVHIEASKVTKLTEEELKTVELSKAEDLIKQLNQIPDQNKDFEAMYRYEGAPPQRDFCVRMINLDKFYSKEEINIMSFRGDNKKFGHKKQNYSIFNFKGGSNCNHYWVEYAILRDDDGKIESAVAMGRAKGIAGQDANSSNNFFRLK